MWWRSRLALLWAWCWALPRFRRVTTLRYARHILYIGVEVPIAPRVFWIHPDFPDTHVAWQLLRITR